jgi:hypothetical protein
MLLGVVPDGKIIGFVQAGLPDMDGVRKEIFQQYDQAVAEVLVENQPHAVAATR